MKQGTLKIAGSIYSFYRDGFKGMKVGKKLWAIIFIKVFIMFAVLKVFFFPNYLNTHFQTDEEKGNHVLEQITRNASSPDKHTTKLQEKLNQ